jgi:putative SOS response-associated peptidase YedK
MCGRYYLADVKNMRERFGVKDILEWLISRYNIAPSQEVPAIIADPLAERKLVRFKWGLKPYWARDRAMASGMINARAETVDTKPSFKNSFRRRRCLIPANGFYEWQKEGQRKIPYCIGLTGWDLFAFAGLWDSWVSAAGEKYESCAIITTKANPLVAQIHDRMPVILSRESEAMWLDGSIASMEPLKELLKPYPAEQMTLYEVSPRVNSPKNDEPGLLNPTKNP